MSYVNILDFGAIGDGVTNNAVAIQSAIDSCYQNGGGTVIVPAGRYKTGILWLKSRVELHLSHGAVLLASEAMDDYNDVDAYEQNFSYPDEEWVGKHLIVALAAEDVAITGSGIIDGNGHLFFGEPEKRWRFLWKDGLSLAKNKEKLRPGQLICFVECTRVKVRDIRIQNATCWCCFFHGCDTVQVRGITVYNDPTYANTDGLDIDCCRFVTVSDCVIDTGDDAIAIRGNAQQIPHVSHGSEYITISNCVLGSSSSAFRIGVGNRAIRHVRISNVTVTRAATVFHLMTQYFPDCYTPLSDIAFHGISFTEAMRVFEILASAKGPVSAVSFTDIHGEVYGGSCVAATAPGAIDGLRLEQIDLTVKDAGPLSDAEKEERGAQVLRLHNLQNSNFRHVAIIGAEQTSLPWDDTVVAADCDIRCESCNFKM